MGKAIIAAFAAGVVVKLFLFDLVIADGNSMEPTIHSGSVLIVSRIQYGLRLPGGKEYILRWAKPGTGDVVVFYTPSGSVAVKRCGGGEEGTFLAVGDNSNHSYDSRFYGPVPVGSVIGRVIGVI
jgi:signal peptidase I